MKFFRALKKHVFDQKTFLLIFLSNPKWVFMFFEGKPLKKFCPETVIENCLLLLFSFLPTKHKLKIPALEAKIF